MKAFAAHDLRLFRDGRDVMQNSAEHSKLGIAFTAHRLVSVTHISGGTSSNDLVYRLFEIRTSGADGGKLVAHPFTVWRATADGGMGWCSMSSTRGRK